MLGGRGLMMCRRCHVMAVDVGRIVVPRVQICVIAVCVAPSKTGRSDPGAGVIAGRASVKAVRTWVIGSCRMKRATVATSARMAAATTAGMVSERRKR